MRPTANLWMMTTMLVAIACADDAATPTSFGPPEFTRSGCTPGLTAEDARARITEIDALAAEGALTPGQAEALRRHLLNVLRSLDAGKPCSAIVQLEAFERQVRNFVNAGALTPAQAAPLLEDGTVGNTAPTVIVEVPVEGGLFEFGETIPFSVVVTDPEDGVVDCARVAVMFVLGHDSHGHPQDIVNGCDGVLSTNAQNVSHGGNVFGTVIASYTDLGGPAGAPPLTTSESVNIRQKRQQVEFVLNESGTDVAATNDPAGGGQHRGSLGDGDWIALNGPFDLVNITSISFRVASTSTDVQAGSPMARIEVRLDAVAGPILATALLTSTGDAANWQTQTVPVVDPGGPRGIYLVFRSVPGGQTGDNLFNLNWVEFDDVANARQ